MSIESAIVIDIAGSRREHCIESMMNTRKSPDTLFGKDGKS